MPLWFAVPRALSCVVPQVLGREYLEFKPLDIEKTWAESSPAVRYHCKQLKPMLPHVQRCLMSSAASSVRNTCRIRASALY